MANGTTSLTYPQSLQQILGQPSQPGVFGYGLSQSDIQRLQDAGITQAQLMGLGLTTQPQTTTSAYQSGGQGGPTTSPSAGGIQQSNNAALLQAMLKLGGPQQQQTGPPPPGNYYGTQFPMYAVDAQGNPTGKPSYANPTDLMGLLGSAALQMPYVKNQVPSATLDPRSGVSKVGGPLISANVPIVPTYAPGGGSTGGGGATGSWGQSLDTPAIWNQVGMAAGLSPDDISAFQRQGLTATQVAKKFGVTAPQANAPLAGPWSTQPGIFVQAARTAPTQATPLQAAGQPTATAYSPTATPFATPPAAPGMPAPMQLPPPVLAAHTSGLEDAGKAIFAHFGGDPNSATPAHILDFHNQLTAAIGQGVPQSIASQQAWASQHGLTNPTFGSSVAMQPWAGILTPSPQPWAGPAGTAPQPWMTGSRPPPPGMPATPAEGITALSGEMGPANTAAALAGLRGTPLPPPSGATRKMKRGGVVPGRGNKDTVPALLTPGEYVIPKDQVAQFFGGRTPVRMAGGGYPTDDQNQPPEARRQTLTTPASQPTTPTQPTSSSSSSAQSSAPPAAPGGGGGYSTLMTGLTQAAHAYSNSVSGRSTPYYSPGQNVWIGSSPGAGQSGFAYGSQAAAAADPGATGKGAIGMGGMSQGMKSALGGIGSGLTQAAQDIAASAKPWQMQQSAPMPVSQAPQVQFQAPPAPQQAQGAVNPYAAYASNQALYPTSPYYR